MGLDEDSAPPVFEALSADKREAMLEILTDHFDALVSLDPSVAGLEALESAQDTLEARLAKVLDPYEFDAVLKTLAERPEGRPDEPSNCLFSGTHSLAKGVGPSHHPIPSEGDFVPQRIIVGFFDDVRDELVLNHDPQRASAQRLRTLRGTRAGLFSLPMGADVMDTVEALRETGRFDYVEPDYLHTVDRSVNDPDRSDQWNFDAVNAEDAWDLSTGSGIVVAVIDTGLATTGYDGINAVTTGYDFYNNDSDPYDDHGHGTHVSGTIAQSTDNSLGVAGLAFDATIMPLKVCNAAGRCSSSAIVDAIDFAIVEGADVINMSLGQLQLLGKSRVEGQRRLQRRYLRGRRVGEQLQEHGELPRRVQRRGCCRRHGTAPTPRPRSPIPVQPSISWPPGSMSFRRPTREAPPYTYPAWSGTSMASPHVAAAAALLMSVGATHAEAEQHLKDTAIDLGDAGWDSEFGDGLIQPDAALESFHCARAYTYAYYGYYYTLYAELYAGIATLSGNANSADAETCLAHGTDYAYDAYYNAYYAYVTDPGAYSYDAYVSAYYASIYDWFGAYYAGNAYAETGSVMDSLVEAFATYGYDLLGLASIHSYTMLHRLLTDCSSSGQQGARRATESGSCPPPRTPDSGAWGRTLRRRDPRTLGSR